MTAKELLKIEVAAATTTTYLVLFVFFGSWWLMAGWVLGIIFGSTFMSIGEK